MDYEQEYETQRPSVKIKNAKTGFTPVLINDDNNNQEVVFSYSHNFSKDEMKKLLKLCNALDFEPYREKKMSMYDEGYCGYRDEVNVYFTGVTSSHIPLLELPMDYFYDEKHIWPSEKLYRFVITTFLNEKKLRRWVTSYGGLSLMF